MTFTNGTAVPHVIDPAGLQAIIQYLREMEAHLQDPEANPEPPLAALYAHSAHGCLKAVYAVPDARDGFLMMGVSFGSEWLHLLRQLDCAALRLVVAFGLQLSDEHLDHGMDRLAVRAMALEHFDIHGADYPFPISRDQYAKMLDLAFGLGDLAYGTVSEDGRFFPDYVDHSAEAV